MPLLTGCLEETYPTSSMTQEQVNQSGSTLKPLSMAMPRRMMELGYEYSSIGYAGIMLALDVAAGESPVADATWDYPRWYANDTYLGESGQTVNDWWVLYTDLIREANLVLMAAPQSSEATKEELQYIGNALAYRAMAYLDMARLYEYKHTGYSSLDGQAEEAGIYKMTVPLITENTTEQESYNNQRQPFYVIYRYIMDDLNRAEVYLGGYRCTTYNMADAAVVYGLKARLWLEMGTRFEKYEEDLQTMIAHENDEALKMFAPLGVKTAKECFANAAAYARLAINETSGPLTEEEWYDTKSGFNSGNHAWLWAVQINNDDIPSSLWAYLSFIGMTAPEAEFGVACASMGSARMIDAKLYSTIEDGDWRKKTWISPDDAGDESKAYKYATLLSADEWAQHAAYTGFKFRPGQGDMNSYMTGVAVDIPLMRVEEMYLIEAEALGHANGIQAGVKALKDFVGKYRFTKSSDYKFSATTIEELTDEVLRQKSIELWGEGIVAYDYKRLEKAVIKDYDGTNHLEAYRSNTLDGYVAPRLNICFPIAETLYNSGLVNNPDPATK